MSIFDISLALALHFSSLQKFGNDSYFVEWCNRRIEQKEKIIYWQTMFAFLNAKYIVLAFTVKPF